MSDIPNGKLINFYSQIKDTKKINPHYDIHKIEIPFRMLVCTASGGGKTNFILNLLYNMSDTFHKIIIVTKAEEPLYNLMINRLKGQIEIYYEGQSPALQKLEDNMNGCIIYDDQVMTKDNNITQTFIRGRKLGYSSIYISQSFFGTPKIVRQNVNYVALGRGINKRDLKMILSEYSIGLSNDQLETYYFDLTKTKMHFMLLDLVDRNLRHNIKDIITSF